jgi:photosystem II stability/assembly factor-like uncharacterized protein
MLRRLFFGGVIWVLPAGLAAPLHGQIDMELLAGMQARSIGPAGMSGRVAVVKAVDSNPDIVYVGAATGGLWKSENGGLTWEPIFDDQPVAAIGAIAIYQASPDIVWIGTGEGNTRNSVSVGNGVYRSMDGGRTWTHAGLDKTERIHRIYLDPSDPDVAYVAAMGALWGENPERGVYKTEDGGKTWSKILYIDEKTGVADMEMDPTNPNKLIVAMWEYRRWPWFFNSGGPGSGIYLTVDGGRNWKKLTEEDGLPAGELGRTGLAIAPSSPNIVYALVEAKENALYKSEDGGYSWSMASDGDNIGNRPFYYADLRVDPKDANRVYSLWSRISVSTDGGRNFESPGGYFGGPHPDHHAMWINPSDPSHIIDGNDGGVYVSRDYGTTWRFVFNLPLAQFYHISVDMEQPYNVLGGMQDNGSWRGPSSVWENGGIRNHHWEEVGFGDGFAVLADPNEPMAGYSMSQEGFLRRYDLRTGERKDVRPAHPDGVPLRFNWNAAIAIDPFDANTVYYGSQFVHKSNDRGDHWALISGDLTTNNPEWQKQAESGGLTLDVTGAENFTTIMTIAPSALERGVIWAGTDDGRVHVTQDGGASWQSVQANIKGVPENSWVPHIEPSKYDPATAYIVFDNHRRSDWTPYVYVTSNYGKSWKSLATDDLWGYTLVIEQDPVKEDLLFLGTEFGLYVSVNGGAQWVKWTHGFPTVSAMALVVHPRENDLVIGTHGRAAYVLDDISPLRSISAETMAEPIHLFAMPDAQQYRVKQTGASRFPGNGEYRGENRRYGAMLTFSLNADDLEHPNDEIERQRKAARREAGETEEQPARGPAARRGAGGRGGPGGFGGPGARSSGPQVDIEISDSDGEVIRTFQSPVKLGVNRAFWNLRRDGFERPSTGQGGGGFFGGGGGPEVLPGAYTVKIKYGDHEVSGSLNVLADPRFDIPHAVRVAKFDAIMHAGALQEVATGAIERIRQTRTEVDDVLQMARSDEPETTTATNGQGSNGDDNGNEELMTAGRSLNRTLTQLEERFWVPPGTTKGIVADTTVFSKIRYVYGSLNSSWDAPTGAQQTYLAQAEAELQEVVAEINRVFGEDVAAFRGQVEAANLEFLKPKEELQVPSR